MSCRHIFEAFEVETERPSEKLVFLALCYFKGPSNQIPCPAIHEIAEVTGLCLTTVRKALDGLQAQGLIWKRDIPGHTSQYALVFDWPNWMRSQRGD